MMKFSTSAFMLLICTAALLSTTEGSSKPMHLRCECIQTYSGPAIPFKRIQSLKVTPAGPKCKYEEIIASNEERRDVSQSCKRLADFLSRKFNQKNVTSRP
ncbi:hypothetical protein cypCar_00045160 [Cyprinus carpio]|nr:hypothetical protein cypCar_00045160 [Cyprinus carpio]